jgi:RNA polymerase primary sigma factor
MAFTASKSELSDYLTQISRHPVLTVEAQLRHCRRVQALQSYINSGTTPPPEIERKGKHSIDVMLRTNLRLVVTIARSYLNRGLEFQDVIQEGNCGLLTAIKRFDPERGYAFSTYAYWWIRQAITRALQNDVRTIRVPVHAQEDINAIRNYVEAFADKASPTSHEIAEATGLSIKRVEYLQGLTTSKMCLSLDYSAAHQDVDISTLHEAVASEPCASNCPERALESSISGSIVERELKLLDPMQQCLVVECFYNNRSIKEVADRLGIKKSRASMLRRRALSRMRTGLLLAAMGN